MLKTHPNHQIKAAVEAARRRDATIPEGYATAAIAAGKTVNEVKAELFDRIAGVESRAMAKASMLKLTGQDPSATKADSPGMASMRKLTGHPPKGAA